MFYVIQDEQLCCGCWPWKALMLATKPLIDLYLIWNEIPSMHVSYFYLLFGSLLLYIVYMRGI